MTDRLLTTAEVAELLAVGREWVRDHAGELGAIRVGDGPRGELRFRRVDVDAAIDRRRVARPRTARRRPGPPRSSGMVLLPIPEE